MLLQLKPLHTAKAKLKGMPMKAVSLAEKPAFSNTLINWAVPKDIACGEAKLS